MISTVGLQYAKAIFDLASEKSLEDLVKLDFPGYAIGGISVRRTKRRIFKNIKIYSSTYAKRQT